MSTLTLTRTDRKTGETDPGCRFISGALLQLPLSMTCKPIFITDLGSPHWVPSYVPLSYPTPRQHGQLSLFILGTVYVKAEHQCLILLPAPPFKSPFSPRPLDLMPACHHRSLSCCRELASWSSPGDLIGIGYFLLLLSPYRRRSCANQPLL